MVTYQAVGGIQDDGAEYLTTELATPVDITVVPYTATPGEYMHILGEDPDPNTSEEDQYVYQYTLSTPYNITTATFDTSFQLLVYDKFVRALAWNDDPFNAKDYIAFDTGEITSYSHSQYDVASGGFIQNDIDLSADVASPQGHAWEVGGGTYHLVGDSQVIHQYTAGTDYDLSTLSLDTTYDTSQDASITVTGLGWSRDGRKLFISSLFDSVYQWDASTPYDIATLSYDGSATLNNSQDDSRGIYQADNRLYSTGFDPDSDPWATQYVANPILNIGSVTSTTTVYDPGLSASGVGTLSPPAVTSSATTVSPAIGTRKWQIDGTAITVVSVRLTPEELTLEVRARSTAAKSVLDNLDSNAGAFETRERADGTIQNRDTAAGNNSYTVTPSVLMRPPRTIRGWRVDNVTRDRTSSDTEAIAATVTLVPAATRDPVEGYADTADSDLWEFDFGSSGQVVTASVANIQQGETSAIELVLTPPQAELVETVTGAIAGAITFTVPDGDTFTRDETPDDRQTVTITPPSSASDPAIPADTYVVTGWESRGSDGGGYRLTLNISTRYE